MIQRQAVPEAAGGIPPGLEAPAVPEWLDGLFGGLGVRRRVVLIQLPLSVTLGLVVVTTAVFSPATLAEDGFRLALLAQALPAPAPR